MVAPRPNLDQQGPHNRRSNWCADRKIPGRRPDVTGLFLSNENTIGPAIDLLVLVLREASRDRR